MFLSTGCNNDDGKVETNTGYSQVNLVADGPSFGTAKVDTNFTNAWGISYGATGIFWIASAEKNVVNVYDREGNLKLGAVAVPAHGQHFGGAPADLLTDKFAFQ